MKLALAALGLGALALVATVAHARAQVELPYSMSEAFSTALRFVRVDRGCQVTDRDPDAAYVTFECAEGDKVRRGSLELYRIGSSLRAQVTLPDETHGTELRFLELYERKLRDERGTPPPPRKAPPPPPPDLGAPSLTIN